MHSRESQLSGSRHLVPPPAGATPRAHKGLPGIIVFQRSDQDDQWQLWVANADLSNQRQITSGPYTSGFATWNPDGTRLAFDSNRSDPDLTDDDFPNDVFTMNPDGTGVVQVTNFGGGFSGDPGWSPDGKWLTYESDGGDYPAKQGIYVSRPDGSHLRRVTTLPEGYEFDAAPQFSPDGKRIVFTRFHLDDQGNETSALHVVNVDGTHETRLDATADLQPRRRELVTRREDARVRGVRLPIFTIRPDGTHLRQLTGGTARWLHRSLRPGLLPGRSPDHAAAQRAHARVRDHHHRAVSHAEERQQVALRHRQSFGSDPGTPAGLGPGAPTRCGCLEVADDGSSRAVENVH